MSSLKERASVDRLARASVLAFGIYVAGAAMTYFAQLLIARLITAGPYGVYAYVIAWMTILAYVAALGFDVSLMRLIPTYRVKQQLSLARGVIQYAERRCAATGLTILLAGEVSIWLMGESLNRDLAYSFYFGFALVPVWGLLWVTSAVVRAFGGVVSALAPDRIVRDGTLILLLTFLGAWGKIDLNTNTVMFLTLICAITGLILARFNLRRWRPASLGAASPEYLAATWRRITVPLVSISVAETMLNRTGVLLLGWSGQTTAAGVYALVSNLSVIVMLPRMAINSLYAPLVSDLMARADRPALQFATTRAAVWTFVSALCIATPVILLANPLLSWFGRDFTIGATAMTILLGGQIVSSAFGSQMFLMTMTGHEYQAAGLLIIFACLNAIGGALLISTVGLTGAAIATSTAIVLWNVAMSVFIWRRLGIVPGVWALFQFHGARVRT